MTNDFDTKGYLYLKDVLSKDRCKEYVKDLHKLIQDENIGEYDGQVNHAHATYGFKNFDKLLEDLLPTFEKATGLKLFPTYSFARLYKPGAELHKHIDRESCEISATLTLGFEGDPWAIFMEGSKINIDVGDAVVYKGCELEHWREKYTEGQWTAQVFLHYVDANGPYKDYKFDNRKSLGTKPKSTELPIYAYFKQHLTNDFCDKLIQTYSADNIEKLPPTIGDENPSIDLERRNVDRVLLPATQGIAGILNSLGLNSNYQFWQYNITHSIQSEFLIYKPEGHYTGHVDTFHNLKNLDCRKLTVLAFLNDDFEGGKFWINGDGNKFYPEQNKGTVIAFPSYMVHGVEPVTKGTRYSIVTWMLGPYFK